MSTGGEVANALVCKTSIRRFNSGPVLQAIRRLSTDSGFGVITDNTPPTSKLLKLTPK